MDSQPADFPTHGALRVLRGSLVGAGVVAVAVASHLAGGGTLPSPQTLVGLGVAAAGFAWWYSGRRWAGSRLIAVLLALQGLLHLVFPAPDVHGHHGGGVWMLVGHLVASVITVRMLSAGESWLWDVADALGLHVVGVLRVASAPVPPEAVVTRAGTSLRVALHLRSTRWRRGPPAQVALH